MSSNQPGPHGPEYLMPGPPMAPGRRSRKGLWIAGGLAGVAIIGGAAVWGATWFFGTGAQPAEALPANTVGYVSIDLDPSGKQKIEAVNTLRKFPAIRDELKIDAKDDLRPKIFEAIVPESCDVDYDKDVKPWIGDRFAMGLVDLAGDTPAPVAVLQVSSADKALKGVDALIGCAGDSASGPDAPVTVQGDWMLISDTAEHAKAIASASDSGSLADDADFKKWSDEAGGTGIVNLYASPGMGEVLADNFDDLVGTFGGSMNDALGSSVDGDFGMQGPDSVDSYGYGDEYDTYDDSLLPTEQLDKMKEQLRDFGGGAISVRFSSGSLEVEYAGDAGEGSQVLDGADGTAGDLVGNLPGDTAAAIGFSLPEGWADQLLKQVEKYAGDEFTRADIDSAAAELGLTLPGDLEDLLGGGVAVSLGGDLSVQTFTESDGPQDLPLGIVIDSPKDKVQSVFDKVLASAPADEADQVREYLTLAGDDQAVLSPNPEYRQRLLDDHGLSKDSTYRNVIGSGSKSGLLFINFNRFDSAVKDEFGADQPEAWENFEPLGAIGMSGGVTGEISHVKFTLTTD